ncbi:hypothetical protein [Psychrobacillus sp. FSL H8-0510]|uniref:hypothetical protein n=1 Tax=Psychrobacillus sp. FSL H8-0510 TaxID=2921394 RepID=UPI0030FB8ECB
MLKTVGKWTLASALAVSLLSGATVGEVGQAPISVKAKTNLPDNHTIEQLKVDYDTKGIHVGDRKGTLLIRVDQPKTEWNIEWVNWSIQKPTNVQSGLRLKNDMDSKLNRAPIMFLNNYIAKGEPDRWGKEAGAVRDGVLKFSDFTNANYYAGLAVYLPQKYNSDGIYYFSMSGIREEGQVKAYFYHNIDVVEESIQRVKTGGTFPLLNKVMWGKTELWKGQLGKVSIKSPVTLWKRESDGKYTKVRELSKGDEFRVYRYLNEGNGYYGVGAGMYVQREASKILYETPSKRNLRLIQIMYGEE